jgi:VWFA-related protein
MMRSLFLSSLVVALAAQTASEVQVTVPRLQVDETAGDVKVFLSVLDKRGSPIQGLVPAKFKTAIDGKPVADVILSETHTPQGGISVVLGIDVSGSMHGAKIDAARTGAERFLKALGDRDYCALMTFGNRVYWLVDDFTNARQALEAKVESIQATDQQTVLNEAIAQAAQKAKDAQTAQVAVIILTDGRDEGSNLTLDDAVREAQENRIPIYTLGFGDRIDAVALAKVATMTGGRFQAIEPDSDLVDVYLSVLSQLSSRYALAVPVRGLRKGLHSLSIDLDLRGAQTVRVNFELAHDLSGIPWLWIEIGLLLGIAVTGALVWRSRRVTVAGRQELRPVEVWLELVGGGNARHVILTKEVITLGREADRDIVFEDKSVSSDHTEIRCKSDGRYFLKASRRSDGQTHTYLNDKQIEIDETLGDNDEIRLGNSPEKVIFRDQRARSVL